MLEKNHPWEVTMFDNLKFDRSIYPSTSYVAKILFSTGPGYQWCLDFFDWARQEVDAKRIDVKEVFTKFKELTSRNLPQEGILRVDVDKVDWRALFNFVEENTRLATIESYKRNPALGALFGSHPLELKLMDSEGQETNPTDDAR
jgi:hypothetical protein